MKKLIALCVAMVASPTFADGSPWLPEDGSTSLSVELSASSTTDFFRGDDSVDLGGDLDSTFLWFNAQYGYDDVWAFDFRTGYAQREFENNPSDQEDISDTSLGVSYQFVNEFENENGWPTVSARAGFTIGGDYQTDEIDAIGDGASGLDLSLLVGKSLTPLIAVSGDLTFRQRDDDVADGIKYQFSGFYTTPIPGVGVQISAAGIRTDSDLNLGEAGVGVEQLPQTDRDSDWLILGVNGGFDNGIGVSFAFANLLSARNVADGNVGTFSLSYNF